MTKPTVVTCGLPYANGPAHIGHLRTYIPADVYVRTLRREGNDVVFVCGSDTHGTPVVLNAEDMGITPKELVTKYHDVFDATFSKINVKFDYFGNTDSKTNHERTLSIINSLIKSGYVYPKNIDLAYCPACSRFLPDRYIKGTCPACKKPARGDECDQGCGKHLEPGEIENPLCSICGSSAEYRTQEHFFFRLSEFSDFLADYLPNLGGTSNARNYALGWVKQKLTDWCITRNLEWGVAFPDHEGLVVYVWVDAPIGYVSFTEDWCNENGVDWRKYWQNDSNIIHFIGGDIIYHHCIFWPAILKGAGYSCPTDVVASGMVKVEDKTFSKSRGYVVWVDDDYLDKGFHPDLLRYYLVSYTSHTKELNFSWKLFGEKINNELVGALGNFMHRTLHLVSKNFGVVPDGCLDPEVLNKIESTVADFRRFMHEYEFKQAVDAAVGLSIFGNSYLQANEPWKLMKTDEKAAGRILKNALQISKALTIMLEAVMPESMARAWEQLGMQEDLDAVGFDDATVEIKSGQAVNKPEILFTKLDDSVIANMEETLNERIKTAISKEAGEAAKSGTPEADAGKGKNKEGDKAVTDTEKSDNTKTDVEYVTFDDFGKMDIRIGKIVSAENIPKSKKLLKLMVDLGEDEPRQIVAGIANDYEPEALVGKLVSVLSNMKPAKLMGVESNGMIMAADNGKAILLKPDVAVDAGTPVH